MALLLGVIVALIIVPFEAVAIPLLLLVNRLPWFGGETTWLNTYHVQIIPFIADAFSIFLFYQFFISIPKDLEEAALVDGASRIIRDSRDVEPESENLIGTVRQWIERLALPCRSSRCPAMAAISSAGVPVWPTSRCSAPTPPTSSATRTVATSSTNTPPPPLPTPDRMSTPARAGVPR